MMSISIFFLSKILSRILILSISNVKEMFVAPSGLSYVTKFPCVHYFKHFAFPLIKGSRHNSPRPSIVGKSRKRALTHSPFSDYLDIESLTRSSEGSLQLAPIGYNSRSSSTASGSYGHLSAG